MRQIKPETAIRRRVKALQEALKAADEEKQTVVSPLIGQVARLEYQLQKLMEQLEESDDDMGRAGRAARNPGENRGDYGRVPRHEEVRAR